MAVFLGIDPGLSTVGFGVIEAQGEALRFIDCGIIKTSATTPFGERLLTIEKDLVELLDTFRPAAVGIEELFFTKNVTNALKVAHARGVILKKICEKGLPYFEFSPTQVKSDIAGYGNAPKEQIQKMIQHLLGLSSIPKPDDAADALAMAILAGRFFESSSRFPRGN